MMKRTGWVRGVCAVLFALSLMGPARGVRAAEVPCSAGDLIAAMDAANASPGDDTINMQAGCVYLLAASNNTAWGANGLPVVADQKTAGRLTINGHGAKVVRGLRLWLPALFNAAKPGSAPARSNGGGVDGGGAGDSGAGLIDGAELIGSSARGAGPQDSGGVSADFRILRVAAGGNLTLNDLTLVGGRLVDENGGAISNSGTLALNHCSIQQNAAVMGGGIYNLGALAVSSSTIQSNTASTIGGGISSGGALKVSDSLFSGNSAVLGDGILIAEGASTLSGSTFSGDGVFTCPAFPYSAPAGDAAALVTAVHCANGGPNSSVINLSPSTYTLAHADNAGFGQGDSGLPVVWNAAEAGTLTVNGGGAGGGADGEARIERSLADGTPEFRVWMVGAGGDLTLNQLVVANGRLSAFGGGGIYASSARLTLNHAQVFNSRGTYGGGISADASTVTLADSSIVFNTSSHDGAAVGMNGTLKVSHSEVVNNTADGLGGGILIHGALEMTDTLISQNRSSAAASGAGLLLIGPDTGVTTATVSGCTISYNNGTGAGGAMFTTGNTATTITNSTFAGNSAGWGIIVNHGTMTVAHSTISGNQSSNISGGISNEDGTLYLRSSIVAGNTTTHDSPDLLGTVISQGYNLIGSTTGATITGDLSGNKVDEAAQPLNLGPVDWNGGPTQTMALLPGSAAINAGSPTFLPPPDYDQRGPGFARVSAGRVDIGAYERQ